MMRILLDVHQIPWEDAWRMTQAIFSYTNHTLLPEALEVWPVPLMERLLPRHMQIIYLINALHLGHVRKEHPGDDALLSSVSMIDEHQGRRVRMSHLAFLGSHRVNGVSALHTGLMRETVFRDLHDLYPGPDRQRHQRHRFPPLAARGQPAADPPAGRRGRPATCWTTRTR